MQYVFPKLHDAKWQCPSAKVLNHTTGFTDKSIIFVCLEYLIVYMPILEYQAEGHIIYSDVFTYFTDSGLHSMAYVWKVSAKSPSLKHASHK